MISEAGASVRVMVVDDHPLWRDAIAHDLTAAGYQVVAVASDGHEALRWAPATRPDVLLLDLHLPGLNGVDIIRQVGAVHPCRVLVLSASAEPADVLAAMAAGASGYLLKSVSRTDLLDAVGRTSRGEAVFTPSLAGLVLGEYQRIAESPAHAATPGLTQREREVLRLVALGLTSRQIADRLEISHRTVQNHTQNVLTKLQLHNRVELARYAIEQGMDGDTAKPLG